MSQTKEKSHQHFPHSKKVLVVESVLSGTPIKEVAAMIGVHRSTVDGWVRSYKKANGLSLARTTFEDRIKARQNPVSLNGGSKPKEMIRKEASKPVQQNLLDVVDETVSQKADESITAVKSLLEEELASVDEYRRKIKRAINELV